jgi:hypothetical protein
MGDNAAVFGFFHRMVRQRPRGALYAICTVRPERLNYA